MSLKIYLTIKKICVKPEIGRIFFSIIGHIFWNYFGFSNFEKTFLFLIILPNSFLYKQKIKYLRKIRTILDGRTISNIKVISKIKAEANNVEKELFKNRRQKG